MTTWIALLAGCHTAPEPAPSPDELLAASAGSVAGVAAVRYDYAFEGQGSLAMAPRVSGAALLSRGADRAHARLRVRSEILPPASVVSDDPAHVMEIASDGTVVTAVVPEDRRAFEGVVLEGADELITHFGGNGQLGAYIAPEPFERELREGELSVEGREVVDGVPCDLVRARFPDGSGTRWALGVEDHLPRGFTEWFPHLGDDTRTVLRVSNLRVLDHVDEAELRIEAPEGFERVRLATHLAPGATLPAFTGTTSEGQPLSDADLRGAPALIVFAAATDVRATSAVLDLVGELSARTGVRALAFGMPALESGDPAAAWTAAGRTFPLIPTPGDALDAFRAQHDGLVYVFDASGRLVWFREPSRDLDPASLEQALEAAR